MAAVEPIWPGFTNSGLQGVIRLYWVYEAHSGFNVGVGGKTHTTARHECRVCDFRGIVQMIGNLSPRHLILNESKRAHLPKPYTLNLKP